MSELESERNWINNLIIIFNPRPINLSPARSTVTEPQGAPQLTPAASPVAGSSHMPEPRPPAAEPLRGNICAQSAGDVCAQARSHPAEQTCASHTPGTSARSPGTPWQRPRVTPLQAGLGTRLELSRTQPSHYCRQKETMGPKVLPILGCTPQLIWDPALFFQEMLNQNPPKDIWLDFAAWSASASS